MTKDKRNYPLMPKATAVWLIENTSLTFKQIADFCGIHTLEVQAIADGEVAQGMIGVDPIKSGELAADDLARAEADESLSLTLIPIEIKREKNAKKYIPMSKRGDKPNAIHWIIKNYPEIPDGVICKLIGSTKNTVQSIRDRTHWNIKNITSKDPVRLGLCTQTDLERLKEKYLPKKEEESSAPSDLL